MLGLMSFIFLVLAISSVSASLYDYAGYRNSYAYSGPDYYNYDVKYKTNTYRDTTNYQTKTISKVYDRYGGYEKVTTTINERTDVIRKEKTPVINLNSRYGYGSGYGFGSGSGSGSGYNKYGSNYIRLGYGSGYYGYNKNPIYGHDPYYTKSSFRYKPSYNYYDYNNRYDDRYRDKKGYREGYKKPYYYEPRYDSNLGYYNWRY